MADPPSGLPPQRLMDRILDGVREYNDELQDARSKTDQVTESAKDLAAQWHDVLKVQGPLSQLNDTLADQVSDLKRAGSAANIYAREVDLLNEATEQYATVAAGATQVDLDHAAASGKYVDAIRESREETYKLANAYGVSNDAARAAQDAITEGAARYIAAAGDQKAAIMDLSEEVLVYSRLLGTDVSGVVDMVTTGTEKYGRTLQEARLDVSRIVSAHETMERRIRAAGVAIEGTSFVTRADFAAAVREGVDATGSYTASLADMTTAMTLLGESAAEAGATQKETLALMSEAPAKLRNLPAFFQQKIGGSLLRAARSGELFGDLSDKAAKRVRSAMALNIPEFQKQQLIFDQLASTADGMGAIFDQLANVNQGQAFGMLQDMGFTAQQSADLIATVNKGVPGARGSFVEMFSDMRKTGGEAKSVAEKQLDAMKDVAKQIGAPDGAINTMVSQLQKANNFLESIKQNTLLMIAAQAAGSIGGSIFRNRSARGFASRSGRAAGTAARGASSRFGRAVAGARGVAGRAGGVLKAGGRLAGRAFMPVAAGLAAVDAIGGIHSALSEKNTANVKAAKVSEALGGSALALTTFGLSETDIGKRAIGATQNAATRGIAAVDPLGIIGKSQRRRDAMWKRQETRLLPKHTAFLEESYEKIYFWVASGSITPADGAKRLAGALDAAASRGIKVGRYAWMKTELKNAEPLETLDDIKAAGAQVWGRALTDKEVKNLMDNRATSGAGALQGGPGTVKDAEIRAAQKAQNRAARFEAIRSIPTAPEPRPWYKQAFSQHPSRPLNVALKTDPISKKVTVQLPIANLAKMFGAVEEHML